MRNTTATMRAIGLALCAAASAWADRCDTDFDGDGLTDLTVYHAERGDWYIRNSRDYRARLQNFGWHQSQPVPGDYDGDGRADQCVYNGRAGEWFVLRSSDGQQAITRGWGNATQDPVCGDFDGDGKNDLAVYDPSNGYWYIKQSRDGKIVARQWGGPTLEPVPGDYNGDGRTDLAVFERSKGAWAILFYGVETARFANWGWGETEPVQADYDGDGRTDLAVYHPSSGDWYIEESANNRALRLVKSGWYNVQPTPGHFDHDNRVDVAAYFAQEGNWLIRPSTIGGRQVVANWGWKGAESAFSSYRVDDDGAHYGVQFKHDYDDDAFEKSANYPRTGWRPGTAVASNSTGGATGGSSGGAVDLRRVTWLHANVSGWAQTSRLRVKVNRSSVSLSYDKAGAWPANYSIGGATVCANPWIFVRKADGSGWHAATWEWMRSGQTTKSRSSVNGDHIKKSPLTSFVPVPGEWYGFMVSGLARTSARNVSERTNIVMVQWPADGAESPWFE